MGPTVNAKTDAKPAARLLPAGVGDVALISASSCAAIGEVSISWWHAEVRAGRAPRPVIQQPRFTRWRLEDARRFWADRASAADVTASERMTAKAKQASVKAREPAAIAKAQATRKARIAAREGAAT